jgi:hypothetical protein
VNSKCTQGGVVRNLIKEGKKPDEILDDIYLRCLARKPTDSEKVKLMTFFKEGRPEEEVLNDLFWAVLNSKEFIFNH